MRELVEGKNKIGRTAAVLKKPYKGTFNPFFLPPSFNYLTAFYEIGMNVMLSEASPKL